ncbi:hypothetical protein [Pseudomonas syringae]|uniref:hypothetical protein n=1 Tax=Pseudomonas syringae TaxID=317 RepID=UPI001F392B84|nr:hypothetical protein [Pseudomonas syringae]MCF5371998.1 hypothetical protein [Pseudomonas syringae]
MHGMQELVVLRLLAVIVKELADQVIRLDEAGGAEMKSSLEAKLTLLDKTIEGMVDPQQASDLAKILAGKESLPR